MPGSTPLPKALTMSAKGAEPATVALYVDFAREHARSTATAVAEALRADGYHVALCGDPDASLGSKPADCNVEDAVLLVTIGGDGTLLHAAKVAAPHGIPLFGINTGRLGFLTEIDGRAAALTALAEILKNGFVTDERTALEARVHGKSYFALNDIVVRRTGESHMTPFGIYVDGNEAAHVPADGVIVATPTGSTAYFLSAGGPILSPQTAAFGVFALLPHTLFTRPLVVPDTSTIVLSCDASSDGIALEADGRMVEALHAGDRVTVTRYAKPVRFARRAPLDFFTLLEEKLRWNAPIKERET
jgi:NAD+ kinase